MSSPAQSLASVTHPTSASSGAPPPSVLFLASPASVATSASFLWQNSQERMRQDKTRSSPVKNVMRLEQRNAYQCRSLRHSASDITASSSAISHIQPALRDVLPSTDAQSTDAGKWRSSPLAGMSTSTLTACRRWLATRKTWPEAKCAPASSRACPMSDTDTAGVASLQSVWDRRRPCACVQSIYSAVIVAANIARAASRVRQELTVPGCCCCCCWNDAAASTTAAAVSLSVDSATEVSRAFVVGSRFDWRRRHTSQCVAFHFSPLLCGPTAAAETQVIAQTKSMSRFVFHYSSLLRRPRRYLMIVQLNHNRVLEWLSRSLTAHLHTKDHLVLRKYCRSMTRCDFKAHTWKSHIKQKRLSAKHICILAVTSWNRARIIPLWPF